MVREFVGDLRPRRDDVFLRRTWLALVAPGVLIPRAVIAAAVIVVPWCMSTVQVAPLARVVAAGLLVAQVSTTLGMQRQSGNRAAGIFTAALAAEVLLCGLLLGGERELSGVGLPMAVVVLALCFVVAGWAGVGVGALLVAAGSAAAAGLGLSAPVASPDTLVFGTTLSVETTYAGSPAVDAAVLWFPTALHVETSFGGVSGLGWSAALLAPVLAGAAVALGLGVVMSLWRVRRACAVPPDGARTSGGLARVGLPLLLLVTASTAAAQCEPAGRARFIKGLEVLSHGDLPAATRVFYELVQAQPSCPEARNNLAVLFVEQDRLDEAAQQLQRALQVNPGYERARVNLARVEALLKERQERSERGVPVLPPEPSPTPVPHGTQTADATPGTTQLVDAAPSATPQVEATPTHPRETDTMAPTPAPSATGAAWGGATPG